MELGSQLGLQNRHICQSFHVRNRELKLYSHPHSTLMGNHRMEHHEIKVNTTSLRVSEVVVVET